MAVACKLISPESCASNIQSGKGSFDGTSIFSTLETTYQVIAFPDLDIPFNNIIGLFRLFILVI